ncbi:DMT family transporter [Gilvimarinus sp. F26214L]|uniref:DMT family transporter n=1 Tax=Gilvimarinus sp. DZF01 TaxID=3461371 RepID=UPI004045E912
MPITPDRRGATAALVFLLLGACAIAFAPILVRVSEMPPVATAFYRLALAAPLLVLVAGRQAAPPPVAPNGGKRWIILAGLAFAGDLAFWHLAILHTSVANATLLANCAPIVVTAVAWLWLGERIGPRFLIGLALGIAGAFLLVRSSTAREAGHLLGDVFALVAAVFYSAYLIFTKLARAHHNTGVVMSGSTLVGALALAPVVLIMDGAVWPQTLSGWLVLFALAIVAHIGGQGLIAYAMARLTVSFSSVALLLQPAVAAALAWWLFGEALGMLQFAGAAAILGGVILSRQDQR